MRLSGRRVFRWVLNVDSSRASRAKEPTGECPGPSCSSLREGPAAAHGIGRHLTLSAPFLLRASCEAMSLGGGASPGVCPNQSRHLIAHVVQVYMLLGSVAGKNILNEQNGLGG